MWAHVAAASLTVTVVKFTNGSRAPFEKAQPLGPKGWTEEPGPMAQFSCLFCVSLVCPLEVMYFVFLIDSGGGVEDSEGQQFTASCFHRRGSRVIYVRYFFPVFTCEVLA